MTSPMNKKRILVSLWIALCCCLVATNAFVPTRLPTRGKSNAVSRRIRYQLPLSSILPEVGHQDDELSSTIASLRASAISSRDAPFSQDDTAHAHAASLYRNRSFILERALQQKLQALHLSQQKLLVLQDAAHRVVAQHTRSHDTALLAQHARLESHQRHEQEQQREQREWHRRHETILWQLSNVTSERDDVRRQLATVQAQQDRHASVWNIEQLAWQEQREEERDQQRQALDELSRRHEHDQRVQQQTLLNVQEQCASLQTMLTKERRRTALYRGKLQSLHQSNDALQHQVQELVEQCHALVVTANATAAASSMDAWHDPVEIAQAAVEASLLREAKARAELVDLKQRHAMLWRERDTWHAQWRQATRPGARRVPPVPHGDNPGDPIDLDDASLHAMAVRVDDRMAVLGFPPSETTAFPDTHVDPMPDEMADSHAPATESIESLDDPLSVDTVVPTASTWATLLEQDQPESVASPTFVVLGSTPSKAFVPRPVSLNMDASTIALGDSSTPSTTKPLLTPWTPSADATESSAIPKPIVIPAVHAAVVNPVNVNTTVVRHAIATARASIHEIVSRGQAKLFPLLRDIQQSPAWTMTMQRLQPIQRWILALWRKQQHWLAFRAHFLGVWIQTLWRNRIQPVVERIPIRIVLLKPSPRTFAISPNEDTQD